MTAIDRGAALELVRQAARAPSVHNIQPARWRFDGTGSVQLFRALECTLPAADPEGRDLRTSLGAAFEGLDLALSTRGLSLGAPEFAAPPDVDIPPGHAFVARASIRTRDAAEPGGDPLARWVRERRSFRGRFEPADDTLRRVLSERFAAVDDLRIVLDRSAIEGLARRYDRASHGFLASHDYLAEFYGWCRFSRRHPRWSRDGLNADCLSLSALERRAALLLLRPRVFGVLDRIGLGRALVSEASRIRTSGAILLYCPRRDVDAFDVGRRFYRLWLELTSLGWSLCPLSALADDRETALATASEWRIDTDRRLVNALRMGPTPRVRAVESPRISAEELLV